MKQTLKNKPLVEAIFELRWELQKAKTGMMIDPNYKILIGTMYEKLRKIYPVHEELPTAAMPDEIAEYIVQHRFRKGKNKWPLIQIGPGIITVNDTEGYIWEDFEKQITDTVHALLEVYPKMKDGIKFNRIMLRYIDAIELDFQKEDISVLLKKLLKTEITPYSKLFEGTKVKKTPSDMDLRLSFDSTDPKGRISLRFSSGKKKESDALILETIVAYTPKNAIVIESEMFDWIKKAHDLTDDWFFKLIDGELLRRFK